MTRTKYTYLRNPVTLECVAATDRTTISRLRSYGWEFITRLEYKVWQVANVKTDRLMRAYSAVARH